VAKSIGSSNPHNVVRATLDALSGVESPRQIAARRGKKISDLIGRRGDVTKSSDKADVIVEVVKE
jgi:small subunit ribosomal protein S5